LQQKSEAGNREAGRAQIIFSLLPAPGSGIFRRMEKPDQFRELFRMQKALNERIGMNNEERITSSCVLERKVR
jgi:hypothetical protein